LISGFIGVGECGGLDGPEIHIFEVDKEKITINISGP
jgi:hypothetical protein